MLEGWRLRDYQDEHQCVLKTVSVGLEARLIDADRWNEDNRYLHYEHRIVLPEAQMDGCLQWVHLSSGHTGCNGFVDFFRECFYSQANLSALQSQIQSIVCSCGCHASKQSDSVTED